MGEGERTRLLTPYPTRRIAPRCSGITPLTGWRTFRLGLDDDGHAGPGELEKVLGVPIGETEAAVRFRAADLFGLRCAVDAVTGFVQADPGGADGIVRARRDGELVVDFLGFFGFGENG